MSLKIDDFNTPPVFDFFKSETAAQFEPPLSQMFGGTGMHLCQNNGFIMPSGKFYLKLLFLTAFKALYGKYREGCISRRCFEKFIIPFTVQVIVSI